MASFFGHLYGAAAVSAAAALGVDALKWAPPDQIQALFVLGVVGGLLPDIDSDRSTPVMVLFTLLGVTMAFLVSFSFVRDYRVGELVLTWALIFVLVRFGVFEVFSRITVHRGIWHSLIAAAFSALAVVDAMYHLGGFSARVSLFAGLFIGLGYLTHLCLDEISSLDLRGIRVKRSFGTALKPFSLAFPVASATMFLCVLLLLYIAPPRDSVVVAANELLAKVNLSIMAKPKQ